MKLKILVRLLFLSHVGQEIQRFWIFQLWCFFSSPQMIQSEYALQSCCVKSLAKPFTGCLREFSKTTFSRPLCQSYGYFLRNNLTTRSFSWHCYLKFSKFFNRFKWKNRKFRTFSSGKKVSKYAQT